jgi:pyruvate dehydrogenase E2 component (dihydrolipoamide acetyltransferase)
MALVEVKVPDIGDFKDVEIIELLVKPGDTVKAEQSLVTVESDKASMEIPSSHAGVVKELKVKLGDKINQGTLLLVVEAAGATPAAQEAVRPEVSKGAQAASGGFDTSARTESGAVRTESAAPASGGGVVDVVIPDIGDFDEVSVIEVFIKPGDTIKAEQSLITVESDKASMEIPSSHAGVVKDLKVKVGDKVKKGSLIATVQGAGGAVNTVRAEPVEAPAQPASNPSTSSGRTEVGASTSTSSGRTDGGALPAHEPSVLQSNLPHASPSIRKFARELGVPLDEVKGSGPKGRIVQDDVQAFVKTVMSGGQQTKAQAAKAPAGGAAAGGAGFPGLLPWPQVDFTKFGPVERRDLSRIKKISGANLHRNWVMIPHVTNHDDADITDLEAFRVQLNKENEKSGVKVTMLAFLIKACVAALKKFPEFNASLDGEQLVLKQYVHVGFAADTPNGLMVPVIRDADKKGILQISKEMSELAGKAREGKLAPAEMTGGCFSISSLGGIGGTYFTPIINAPEVAILGVCKSATRPVWDGKAFQPRLVLPLSLSWDHRVIDGASAARFNTFLIQVLGDFRRILL